MNNSKHSEQSEQMVDPGNVSHVAAQILTVARDLGINIEAVGASIGPTFTEFEFTILSMLRQNVAYFVTSKCRFWLVYKSSILVPRTNTFSTILSSDFA